MWRQYWSTGVRSIGSAATITLEDIVIELAKTTDETDKVYNHVQIFNLGVKLILLLSASSFFAFQPVWFSNLFRRCTGFVFVLINSLIGALLHSTDIHIILCPYICFLVYELVYCWRKVYHLDTRFYCISSFHCNVHACHYRPKRVCMVILRLSKANIDHKTFNPQGGPGKSYIEVLMLRGTGCIQLVIYHYLPGL